MHYYKEQRLLPYTQAQVFDLVADVEHYHEFVPGWLAARIVERKGNELIVDQVMGLGAFRLEFVSHTSLKPPGEIQIVARDGPFRYLDINWFFEPTAAGCRTRLSVEFELSSSLLEGVMRLLFGITLRQVLGAFAKRARGLYEPVPGADKAKR